MKKYNESTAQYISKIIQPILQKEPEITFYKMSNKKARKLRKLIIYGNFKSFHNTIKRNYYSIIMDNYDTWITSLLIHENEQMFYLFFTKKILEELLIMIDKSLYKSSLIEYKLLNNLDNSQNNKNKALLNTSNNGQIEFLNILFADNQSTKQQLKRRQYIKDLLHMVNNSKVSKDIIHYKNFLRANYTDIVKLFSIFDTISIEKVRNDSTQLQNALDCYITILNNAFVYIENMNLSQKDLYLFLINLNKSFHFYDYYLLTKQNFDAYNFYSTSRSKAVHIRKYVNLDKDCISYTNNFAETIINDKYSIVYSNEKPKKVEVDKNYAFNYLVDYITFLWTNETNPMIIQKAIKYYTIEDTSQIEFFSLSMKNMIESICNSIFNTIKEKNYDDISNQIVNMLSMIDDIFYKKAKDLKCDKINEIEKKINEEKNILESSLDTYIDLSIFQKNSLLLSISPNPYAISKYDFNEKHAIKQRPFNVLYNPYINNNITLTTKDKFKKKELNLITKNLKTKKENLLKNIKMETYDNYNLYKALKYINDKKSFKFKYPNLLIFVLVSIYREQVKFPKT